MLYLRTDAVAAHGAADLAAEGGSVRVTPETLVALREAGPFTPLAEAIVASGALRDELAAGLPTPSLRRGTRVRWAVLAAAILPIAGLLELDRELVGSAQHAAHIGLGRGVVDIILVATVVFELTRRTPRMPTVAAMALFAIALRFGLVAARLCGGPRTPHVLVYVAAVLAALGGIALLARLPPPSRVVLELLGKLGISRTAFFTATALREPQPALIAAAVASAAGLPALAHLSHIMGVRLYSQGAIFALFGLGAPYLAQRFTGEAARRDAARLWRSVDAPRTLMGVVAGLALAAAAVTAAHLFFDSGTELARCFGRLDVESRNARAAEATELLQAAASVRRSSLMLVLTTTVFPFAEERIYRGLLQDVLVRKYGRAQGVLGASMAFGLAHLGIYHLALYQTVILGVAFGLAYLEGGLLAAFAVHAIWNLLQLT